MDLRELERAHDHSWANRQEVMQSELCGCFFCLETFPPGQITEWAEDENDEKNVALCPYCQIDSVLGDQSGFPITDDFLRMMRQRWFSCC
jgi:hypothetical protein